jgi:hypothetical protein
LFLVRLYQKRDLFRQIWLLLLLKPPEAKENQDGDDVEESLEGTSSTTSHPPAHTEDPSLDRKRKCVEEFLSSSTSTRKNVAAEAPILEGEVELFDALDS